MQVLTVDVRVRSTFQPVLLAPLSDMHVGARDFDRAGFERHVASIVDSDAIPFVLGDVVEAITHRDRRFLGSRVDPGYPMEALDNLSVWQAEDAARLLDPIKDRIAFVAKGNHEEAIARQGAIDPHAFLLERLGAETGVRASRTAYAAPGAARAGHLLDGQYKGLVRWRFIRDRETQVVTMFYHHGWFSGHPGTRSARLAQTALLYDVDLVVVGHAHASAIAPVERPRPTQKWSGIVVRESLGVVCRAWKTGHTSGTTTYEETRGFGPSATGPTLIEIVPATKRARVFFGWEFAC